MKKGLTYKEIEEKFKDLLLLVDDGIIRVVIATVIANQMDDADATWLMVVSASSGGKTEILDTLLDFTYNNTRMVHPFSDLTPNTFASAYKGGDKSDGSFLKNVSSRGAIMLFKDFTTLLSKNSVQRDEILSQLREIYDGSFSKKTGTVNIEWTGRLGSVAGVTEMIYDTDDRMSGMGNRFIMYNMEQPDRNLVSRKAYENRLDRVGKNKKRQVLRDSVKEYLERAKDYIVMDEEVDFRLEDSDVDNLLLVADLSTQARSAVIKDFRGTQILFVPSKEMPMRMADQLFSLAKAMTYMNHMDNVKEKLTELDMTILYRIAFASIPKKRRLVLNVLTKYSEGTTTKGVGILLAYPTETVKLWLQELNALQLVDRVDDGIADKWVIKSKYLEVISRFEGIHVLNQEYIVENECEDDDLNHFANEMHISTLPQKKEAEEINEDFDF